MHDVYANMSEFDRIKNLNKKEGVSLGRYAIHPLTEKRFQFGQVTVLATYGTGAVMAVPGHDERDFDFATTTYDLPIKRVLVEKEDGDANDELETAFTDDGYMVNSGLDGFDGQFGDDARTTVVKHSKQMEGRPSNQLEDSSMVDQSSTILGHTDSNHSL